MLAIALLGIAFVGTHFLMSSTEVRHALVSRFGENGFLGFYSLVSAVLLVLLVLAYGDADRSTYWWYPDPLHYQIAMVVMWLATVLVVASFMAPNPSGVGMGEKAKEGPQGILRVTRHPLMWGIGLWALAHMVANGDVVSVLFFVNFAVLALVGGWLLDHKKTRQLGDDWVGFMAQTSFFPFAAIVGGRTTLAPAQLLTPLIVGSLVYVAMFWGHEWLSGVEIFVP